VIVGQNACTRSCVEDYWGKIGAKINFFPRNYLKITPKSPRQKWGKFGACLRVAAICHTMRTPKDTLQNLSLWSLQSPEGLPCLVYPLCKSSVLM
jgi:hypothetical protein